MIPGSAYLPIYLILVIFSSIVVIQKYRSYHGLLLIDKKGYALFLAIVFSLFIGGRPVDAVFADTVGYATYFKYITPSTFFFLENPENIVFDNIIHFFATSGLGPTLIHISEPTRLLSTSYAVFCLKKQIHNVMNCVGSQQTAIGHDTLSAGQSGQSGGLLLYNDTDPQVS